ncbi:D-alanyl-D-alanine carboxypeptidase family protein [Cupriavidus oxalaticus]|uniref:serine-type D-Ala-D-Ala carboxypeptidase n=1 Tax=Cupriavidus oxalaticus TaxID=96344 RepID=A0A375FZZ5_9BURK|nr:D-alanyl-D-alanine carboxypeptidase family protein [Cupriavidus oxalaticus]QEZ45447.1 D-alanyl-D-alanine carboxypeptidase [Cupriavidus oxalaticus]QRQ87155.1 D-alanyl-D-alanine carboxypeptidase [Cupriavidus oxalaticus]QRQ94517.1 D-alanyl-D-alanine carboxypeptidase [Cupriavidus oxalaticus]WQD83160.1 D-alanyl-D-alanine carboxypeptidase family protein [Cupriavidus oxalaticus]SPC11119.1 Cytochrome C550 [Cupriavidus oxalaticus]
MLNRATTRLSSAFAPAAIVAAVATATLAAAPAAVLAQGVPMPQVAAKSWMLYDATSGQALASQNADQRIEPASLTKLMTAYLAFEALKEKRLTLEQTVVPTNLVLKVKSDESRMFIEPNKPVSVQDLLLGLIVQSGNDAALALAEAVGGSEEGFVAMMNREAQRMGMKNTHFTNTDGIPDPNHYTTAVDLATLTTHLIKDFPEYYSMYSQKEFTYNKIRQPNRNRLLYIDPTVDGVKTGHTKSAGYCLISSAQRPLANVPNGQRRLISIVIGTTTEQVRTQESLKILNYGFQFFDTLRLYDKGQVLATPEIYKGKSGTVKIGVQHETFVTVPKGTGGRLKPVLERQELMIAPIAAGQQVGMVKLMDGATKVAEFPVVALEEVPEAGFFGRLWDTIRLWFKRK